MQRRAAGARGPCRSCPGSRYSLEASWCRAARATSRLRGFASYDLEYVSSCLCAACADGRRDARRDATDLVPEHLTRATIHFQDSRPRGRVGHGSAVSTTNRAETGSSSVASLPPARRVRGGRRALTPRPAQPMPSPELLRAFKWSCASVQGELLQAFTWRARAGALLPPPARPRQGSLRTYTAAFGEPDRWGESGFVKCTRVRAAASTRTGGPIARRGTRASPPSRSSNTPELCGRGTASMRASLRLGARARNSATTARSPFLRARL
jgi:hypothetical protein